MNIEPTHLKGCHIIEPTVFSDARGIFFETFRKDRFEQSGLISTVVQENQSISKKGVLRGIHFQKAPMGQAKLVRVTRGTIWDVAVDLNPESPTYKQWVGMELSEHNRRMALLAPDMGHGFYVLSDHATVVYLCSEIYSPEHDAGVRWNDSELAIDWRLDPRTDPILSGKDRDLPFLAEL
ncbi:dTDP-4-dehydrorhamnose 3,5-epimerase [bacterium]|nr:dTDP-4-dehydrorhamnose 3,5-epimerase [bacterium]